MPVPESLGEALTRLKLAHISSMYVDAMRLTFPGPLPDDATLLRYHEALREGERRATELLQTQRASFLSGLRLPELAEEVRRLQRERPATRALWATYCTAQYGGVKDPTTRWCP